jgi:hypothetical protein
MLVGHVHHETPDTGLHLFALHGRGWRYGNGAYISWPKGYLPTAEGWHRRATEQVPRHDPDGR